MPMIKGVKRTRASAAQASSGSLHGLEELRPILAGFLKRAGWLPNASFLINRSVRVGRRRWTIGLGVHVFGDIRGPRPHKLRFSATITVLPPPDLSPSDEKTLDGMGFFDHVSTTMAGLSYNGEWARAGFGRYASFSKELRTRTELWAEVKRLEALDLRLFGTAGIKRAITR